MPETSRSTNEIGRVNCWEYRGCRCGLNDGTGRSCTATCRAALESALDGVNGGVNGGRACWALVGTLGVDLPGNASASLCSRCGFRKLVFMQEAPNFVDTFTILEMLGYSCLPGLGDRPEDSPRDSEPA